MSSVGARKQRAMANNRGRLLGAQIQGTNNAMDPTTQRPIDRHGLQLKEQARTNRQAYQADEWQKDPAMAITGPLTDPSWDAMFQAWENQGVRGVKMGAAPGTTTQVNERGNIETVPGASSQIRGFSTDPMAGLGPSTPVPGKMGYSTRTMDIDQDPLSVRGLKGGRKSAQDVNKRVTRGQQAHFDDAMDLYNKAYPGAGR